MGAKGAALMLPFANTAAMQMHLDEISCNVAAKAHGVVLMDRAGWHSTDQLKVPKNLTIILLPSRSPELNPVENIWQYLRQNWLSNRVFEDYDAINRGRLPSLEQTNRPARDDHVHRNERLGDFRSIISAVGMTIPCPSPTAIRKSGSVAMSTRWLSVAAPGSLPDTPVPTTGKIWSSIRSTTCLCWSGCVRTKTCLSDRRPGSGRAASRMGTA